MKNKVLTALLCVFTVLLVITGSIALPIYVRPFYYCQIEPLGIPADTGYDKQTIIEAYDEVLDYLTLPNREFGTGVFPHSEEGASHFADCKVLFDLNAAVLLVSLLGVVVLALLLRRGTFTLYHPRGLHPATVCGGSILLAFAAVGGLAALNFDRAFEVFHAIFFPGKDNWLFNYRTDAIITAMPQEFFMNCALLILSSVVLWSLALIIYGICRRKKS